jgi:thiol-disulfide isomerase/thioredoxin
MKGMKNMKSVAESMWNNPLVITIVVILILILILAIFRPTTPFLNIGLGVNAHIGNIKGNFDLEAFDNQLTSSPTVVLFMSPGCGHCRNMKPEWDEFVSEYNGSVAVETIDCSKQENRKLASMHGVQGFPTVRYYPNGLVDASEYVEHEGGRKKNDFMSFCNKCNA